MTFAHPHFAEPRWLWLAFLGPLVLSALYWYSGWARRKQLARLAAPHFLEALTRSHNPLRRAAKNLLLLLAVAGMGFGPAPPQKGGGQENRKTPREENGFVVACSRSMLAPPATPHRMQGGQH